MSVAASSNDTPHSQTVRDWLSAAVKIVASGKTLNKAAAALGLKSGTLYTYRAQHRKFWKAEYSAAVEQFEALGMQTKQQPSEEVKQRIRKATAMIAAGKTRPETAAAIGVALETINHLASYYRKLWQQELDRAMEAVVVLVRREAGTAKVIENPEQYLGLASRCEVWLDAKGESLFPHEKPTLSTFFESYYVPVRLNEAIPQSVEHYRYALRRWRLITGDPPLAEITAETLCKFRDALARMPGQKPGTRLSTASIRRYLVHVQAVLDKSGPPTWRNRDAAGILDRTPSIRKPRIEFKEPQIVPTERIEATYRAAATMVIPNIPGVRPADWWQGLLVVTFNTQLRRRSLFEMTMTAIDWQSHRLVLPPTSMKSHRLHVTHLNTTTIDHLERIRTDRELVFAWPHGMRRFHLSFHELEDAAGIPREQHFGLHALRRTAGTLLWQQSPAAAQLSLGHTTFQVTRDHYVNHLAVIRPALENLPQPEAFKLLG